MEQLISYVLAFFFIYIILTAIFKKNIYEAMEDCSLVGFRKKTPGEINLLSTSDRNLYDCQLKKLKRKKLDPVEFKINNRVANKKLKNLNISDLDKPFNDMVELENNLTNRIIARDDAKNSFVKFVNSDLDEKAKITNSDEKDKVKQAENQEKDIEISQKQKDEFFNENKKIFNPF